MQAISCGFLANCYCPWTNHRTRRARVVEYTSVWWDCRSTDRRYPAIMELRYGLFIWLFLTCLFETVSSEKIGNSILGDPIVECTGSSIRFRIVTASAFQGRLFVRGQAKIPGCEIRANGTFSEAGIEIPFDSPCRIDRKRSISPRGVFVSATVVVSFHPMFITGADRAIRVQCLYQAAEKHVAANIGVNDLPWQKHAQPVEMPVCRYDILADSPDGPLISSASVGQRVFHKWTCETSTPEFFCMRVHSCIVEDGHGAAVSILNEAGCAVDDILLRNLNYTEGGLAAGQTAFVYKYADHDTLFFQCQVSITVRDPSDVNQLARGCPRPMCGAVNESANELTGIRSQTNNKLAVLQVREPRESNNKESSTPPLPAFEVLDVTANLLATDSFNNESLITPPSEPPSKTICLPGPALAGIVFIIALVSVSTIVALIHRIKHRRRLYVIN